MYEEYTAVPEALLPVRDLLMINRKPRPLFVQVWNGAMFVQRSQRCFLGFCDSTLIFSCYTILGMNCTILHSLLPANMVVTLL